VNIKRIQYGGFLMLGKYLNNNIEAIGKLNGVVLTKGKVIGICGSNMLFVVNDSGNEIRVTITDSTEIRIIS
jgi:hypothetical protein